MIALTVAAPLAAAFFAMAFRPLALRRWVRVAVTTAAALVPLTLLGRVDHLSLLFTGIVSALGLLATIFSTGVYSVDWGAANVVWGRKSVYFVLLAAFWSAMLAVVLATNFAVLWLGISATTLATAFLVGFSGEPTALEAAWKYFVLCSVGIGLALLGIVLLGPVALAAGIDPARALDWNVLASHGATQQRSLARLAVAIMVLGFATKAGLVPMHAWLPDAHSKAPAPISALLSGVLVSCSLYALMRVAAVADALGVGDVARTLLLWLGAASLLVAGTLMLAQRDLKRLLAYSTVEHAGIVALALGFGGTLGSFAALFHVVAHAFAKSSAFFAAGLVQGERGTTELAKLSGLWRSGLAGRFVLAAMIALGGMPPFGLFLSEFLVLAAGVAAHQWVALGAGAAGLVLAFCALVRTTVEAEGGHAGAALGLSRFSVAAASLALSGAVAVAAFPWVARLP